MPKRRLLLHSEVASLGGRVTGECKVRGGPEYYSKIAKKGWEKRRNGQPSVYELVKHLKVGGEPFFWEGKTSSSAHAALKWPKKDRGWKFQVETLYNEQDRPYGCNVWRVK